MCSAHTRLLSFPDHHALFVPPLNGHTVLSKVESLLKPLHLSLSHTAQLHYTAGFLHVFTSPDGAHASLWGHAASGLITLDLCEVVLAGDRARFDDKVVQDLQEKICVALGDISNASEWHPQRHILPPIRRGEALNVYYPLVDGRLVEYDFTKQLFHATTQYQDILIVHSPTLGNVLILDGDINLGEHDVIYTHTLMQRGSVGYCGSDCLILGGGDGGLLHEILMEAPNMVTMIDVDEVVVAASRIHLRGICGSALDEQQGPNHKIIIDDALKILRGYKQAGTKFDRVLYDLTAIPIRPQCRDGVNKANNCGDGVNGAECCGDGVVNSSTGDGSNLWEFITEIHRLAFSVLIPGGVYLAQVNAKSARGALAAYESMLRELDLKLEWRSHEAFVPSYHEYWVFYEVWRRADQSIDQSST